MFYYIFTSQGCFIYNALLHNAYPTARGIVPRLRGGMVSLQPPYFLLNLVGDDQKWCRSENDIVARWQSNEIRLSYKLSGSLVTITITLTGFLRHNQIFEVIIEKSDCEIKYLIVIPKARWFLAIVNWTCGQGNCLSRRQSSRLRGAKRLSVGAKV